tara:strand:+ start:9031 stop:9240 length:210 start_codon:yes stop_codon:yes gene_type:complete
VILPIANAVAGTLVGFIIGMIAAFGVSMIVEGIWRKPSARRNQIALIVFMLIVIISTGSFAYLGVVSNG